MEVVGLCIAERGSAKAKGTTEREKRTHDREMVTLTTCSGGATDRNSLCLRPEGPSIIRTSSGRKEAELGNVSTHNRSPKPWNAAFPPTQTMLLQNMPCKSSGRSEMQRPTVSASPAWFMSAGGSECVNDLVNQNRRRLAMRECYSRVARSETHRSSTG